ncbi:hypothetical protein [Paenibacillus marinisediminis]
MINIPLHEDYISQCFGNDVCVVMMDGTRHYGTLSAFQNGRLFLNGGEKKSVQQESSAPNSSKKKKGKRSKKTSAAKSISPSEPEHIEDTSDDSLYGSPIGLDLNQVDLLLLY